MDFLIKNNIIKKTKVIADIGHKYIKLLGVKYENKHAVVCYCGKMDSSSIFFDGEINATELAKLVASFMRTNRLRNCDISLSLPNNVVISKIIEVRNIREKDIDKYIKTEHYSFNRVTPLTHIIDWAYLGKREENGDTIHYCLLSATSKSTVMPILAEFDKRKLKIGTISSAFNDQIHFSDLFSHDYENINRLLVDFGQHGTRVIVFIQGVPVYCREIDIGFENLLSNLFKETNIGIPDILARLQDNSSIAVQTKNFDNALDTQVSAFVHEIQRIIEMFEDDTLSFSKIMWSGTLLQEIKSELSSGGYINIENFNLSDVDNASGTDYIITTQTAHLDSSYNSAIGLAASTYR
jgi:Tfp pilus assembly PilM family ATPase